MSLKDQTVLVTGSAGLFGSSLIARLAKEGARVRATVHSRKPREAVAGVEYVVCDLTRQEDCKAVMKDIRYVFHSAANTSGALDTIVSPMVHVTPNVVMNTWLMDAAYHGGVEKFLFFGSTTAYPYTDKPVKEEDLFAGDLYDKYYFVGNMKRFSEILCQMYGEKLPRRMTTIVVRPSNVYGPGDKFEFERCHVTAALLRKVVERQHPLEVWGTGDDVRDLIYVDDIIDGTLLAMEKIQSYDAVNIGTGKGYSVKQILQTLLELEGYTDAKIVFDPSKPTMIPVRLMDVSKAERLLGFRAKTDLREGLRRTIEWFKKVRPVGPK
jgi:GDP-L-fucose synthase